MSENALKTTFILMGGLFLVTLILLERPYYLSTPEMLGGIIAGQLVLAAVCRFKQAFFLALMVAFVWAGTNFPDQSVWLQGRWFVLGAGAVAGMAIYMKDRNHYFNVYHLVAFFCVLAAFISAMVSAYPEESLLKAVSLLLLFVYGSTGARIAVPSINPSSFFRGFLRICEFLTYFTAIAYYVFHWEVYGTSNSFGAVMGVVVVPMMLWGLLSADTQNRRRRFGIGLLVALSALMSSFARAAMCAATISCLALCISLRQYRVIVKGFAAAIILAVMAITVLPRQSEAPQNDESQSIVEMFWYKGKPQEAAFASRRGPWEQTWKVIKENPWFGSGFGTSQVDEDISNFQIRYTGSHVDTRAVREHGNSYLAIAEWVGLLGVIPFYSLVGLTFLNLRKVFRGIRLSGNALAPVVPCAAIVLAGLVEGCFEDSLFAVGYYLCILIWSLGFILVDLVHASEQQGHEAACAEVSWPTLLPAGLAR